MKYQHVLITHYGGSEVLQLVEDEVPEPAPGEALIRVLATSAAFTDILIRKGLYPGVPELPFSPGYAVIGLIEKCTTNFTDWKPGERVAALTITGGYSQYICLPETDLVPVPDDLDPAEAVSLVLPYVTAYQMLHRYAHVRRGDRILVHGAGGGVGTALLQLGHLAGLEMYGTDIPTKHDLIRAWGATPINYQTENFVQRIQELTETGVDAVFDAVGGAHLWRSFKVLRSRGKLINYGFLSAIEKSRYPRIALLMNFVHLFLLQQQRGDKTVEFYSIADLKRQFPTYFRRDLTLLFDWLAQGNIHPVIAKRLPLAEAAQAHEMLEHAEVNGSLVLICD
ncbi:MAG TPA: zinc-binding dehydrogenase [Leptolyngbyaceae cyanobacterium M33_DOE_097]|uniref:Oxidoreductase n=1 Tax=Oscillatoriales cyanobacterium SpSt-418 TaxID=2282169 RepID=A0A7C3PQH5_9CYAN|nr:zinc-binding dehydrogenase [Leptolyngbyaceae cyanobacterium M33_DOE_097]